MGKTAPKFHVASWNILIDRKPYTPTLPQHQRCDSLGDTLQAVGVPFDFLGLYEVEGTAEQNCGRHIANTLGLKHSRLAHHGRDEEGIMLSSRRPLKNVRVVTLDPEHGRRQAIIAEQGPLAVVSTHLIAHLVALKGNRLAAYTTAHKWRIKEVTTLLGQLTNYETVILMGDFNCLPSHKPRKLLEANGFTSILSKLSLERRSSTFPTEAYRDISVRPWQNRLIPKGISIDDIYIKNLSFVTGDLFEGNSDHQGIWATLER